jgi:ABC-2 type transport system permease protein
MASMMIFFVFFTGAATASTIVSEDEDGTLARLFTTPTSYSTILGGKFLGSLLTVAAQAIVLILASMLLFGIRWGNPLTLAVVLAALIVAAAGFGVFLMSFVRSSRQSGPIQGVVISLTGMIGGLFTTFTAMATALDTVSLAVPQGWALRSMKLTLAGAAPMEVLWPVAVLLAVGLVLFAAGTFMFRRRFA